MPDTWHRSNKIDAERVERMRARWREYREWARIVAIIDTLERARRWADIAEDVKARQMYDLFRERGMP